jgi:transcription elongation factor Elf1
MELKNQSTVQVSSALLEAIRSFPVERELEHCGVRMVLSPFAYYAQCQHCGTRIKVRSFAASGEIEDVFDAVFEWMNKPRAHDAAERRRQEIAADQDD